MVGRTRVACAEGDEFVPGIIEGGTEEQHMKQLTARLDSVETAMLAMEQRLSSVPTAQQTSAVAQPSRQLRSFQV